MSGRIGSIMKYAAAMAVALAFGAALADHPLSDPDAAKLNDGLANSRAVFETTGNGTVAFLGGCAYAAVTELVQSRLPYRSGDPADFRADFVALAACSVLILILIFTKHKK